jgi:hypothetical protein
MFARLAVLVFCSLFICGNSYSADCGVVTVVDCALTSSDDEIVMSNGDTVTITSGGSIIVDDHDNGGLIQLPGSSSNLTIENRGTLQVGKYINDDGDVVGTQTGERSTIRTTNNSTNPTLTNYGTIAAISNTVNFTEAQGNITIDNKSGAIISARGDNDYGTINLKNAGDVTQGTISITNAGTIQSSNTAHSITSNAATHYALRLESISGGNTITIDNSGTIKTVRCCAIFLNSTTDPVAITNSGTISSGTHGAIDGGGTTNLTITNSGTITGTGTINPTSTVPREATIALATGSGATITNTGTIESSGSNLPGISIGDGSANVSNVTITNSGTIAGVGSGNAIRIYTGSSGTTINVESDPTFTNGITFGETASTIVLASNIKRDLTIELYDYDDGDLTITDNLSGNDTYALTDVSALGGDNDGDSKDDYNATLTIYGEDLEVVQNNSKYRGENTLTKLRGLFNAANYVGGQWPDYCTTADPEDVDSELDEVCNQRFVKLFHSYQTRDRVYEGTSSGIVGMLSPIKWKGFPLVSNIFVGYSNQEGDFINGEYLGGDNYALGFKNTYENKGFKVSLTPMIGVNDLAVIDYDTDKVQTVTNNFLSEFAAVNGKIKKKIATGEDRSLNVSVETTYGLQRFPDYISKFTDGDLSVDESIEKLLSGGFEVAYVEGLPGSFIIKPYFGANLSKNLSNQIKITADGENKNVSPKRETWSGYYAGVSLTKEAKGIDFDLNLMYGNEDGLINQIAAVSLTKSFGASKKEAVKLEPVPDLPKVDESLTTQDYNKSFKELEIMRDLNKKLKAENAELRAQNEKLKLLAKSKDQENKDSKRLIVELLKENEKIKLTKELFKKEILEHENKELLQSLEESVKKPKVDRLGLFLFFVTVIGLAAGLFFLIIPSKYLKFRFVN